MIFAAGMGGPEALHSAVQPCVRNKHYLTLFPSLQALWGRIFPIYFYTPWPGTAALKAMVVWSSRCYPASEQSWHTLDHRVLWSPGEIVSTETQPVAWPVSLVEHIHSWKWIWTGSLSCFVSTCKHHAVNFIHVISSAIWMCLTSLWYSNGQVNHLCFTCAQNGLPNSAPGWANMWVAAFQMSHVTNAGTFSSGYVRTVLRKSKLCHSVLPLETMLCSLGMMTVFT